MSNRHVFTSITSNYLPKARVLATSVKKWHPDITFHVILNDVLPEGLNLSQEPFDNVIPIDTLPIPNFSQWAFKHTQVELCTAVKGIGLLELLQRYDAQKVIFFDPDIIVLSPLDRIWQALDQHSVLVTPHLTVPEKTSDAIMDNEICSLQHGVFNLGFLAVAASENGFALTRWWSQRLLDYCYDDKAHGLFTDQRWMDLLPAFFEDYQILRQPVFNVATWNLSHRRVHGTLEKGLYIDNEPMVFFHFSGLDSGSQAMMLEKYGNHSPVLVRLREWYLKQCAAMGQADLGTRESCYAVYDNGKPVEDLHRRLYRQRPDIASDFPNPFKTKPTERSYYHWWQVNGVKESLKTGLLQPAVDTMIALEEANLENRRLQARNMLLEQSLEERHTALRNLNNSRVWRFYQRATPLLRKIFPHLHRKDAACDCEQKS